MAGIDLDGTLLTNEKKITAFSEKTLRRAAEAGVCLVPVTGRPLYGMPDALMQIQRDGQPIVRFVITSNGACTYELEEEGRRTDQIDKNTGKKPEETAQKTQVSDFAWKEVRTTLMRVADARMVLKAAEGVTVICEVFTEGYGYHEPSQEEPLRRRFEGTPVMDYIRQSRKCVDSLDAFLEKIQEREGGIENISFMFDSEEDRDTVRRRLGSIRGIHVIVPKSTDLEVVSGRTDKGSALLDLAAHLGIPPEQILAIGDNDNDAGLLGRVGIFAAMGNASEEIRRRADYVTLDNLHDGAAAALEKFCL